MTNIKDNPRHRLMARFDANPRKPEWAEWQKIPNAPVWKAVALSCDIDPDDLEGWRESPPARIPPKLFLNRLEQTIAALSANGGVLVSRSRGLDLAMHRIELGDFRAWADSVGLSMPDQFPVFEISNPPYESLEDKRLRLTMEIRHEKNIGTRNPMETVADRAFNDKTKRIGISTSRLTAIVGSVLAQAERLAAYRNTDSDGYNKAMEKIAALRRVLRTD